MWGKKSNISQTRRVRNNSSKAKGTDIYIQNHYSILIVEYKHASYSLFDSFILEKKKSRSFFMASKVLQARRHMFTHS